MERTCKTCLDLMSEKKTYSTDITMLQRKPANEYYQMLLYYESKYDPRQNNIDFESAKEVFLFAENQ